MLSSGTLIKILTTSKKPPKSSSKSLKPTKFYPIKTKEKPTISTVMKVRNPLEAPASQEDLEHQILISIMLKMYLGTFFNKTLSMMTFLRDSLVVVKRRKKHHQDSVVEGLAHLTAIHFFQVALVDEWEVDYSEHRVCLITMIFFPQTGEGFQA